MNNSQSLRLLSAFLLTTAACVGAFSSSVETIPRKRLGKKSFIQKQERGDLFKTTSSDEIQNLILENIRRTPGSKRYMKLLKNWLLLSIEAIRDDLSHNLLYPADKAKFENLFYRLGVAADTGLMPSFSDAGARSGYALEFFCRARTLAEIYMDIYQTPNSLPQYWIDSLMETPMLGGGLVENDIGDFELNSNQYNVVSLGGGPGFDFVGTALATMFSSIANGESCRQIKTTVFDYEEGWGDLVQAMDVSTRNVLQQPQFSCDWGGKCDVTKALNDPINLGCISEIRRTQLWICQHCVAENANLLQESDFIFFRELFQMAPQGCIFIFTESTPRIWPNFYDLCEEHCKYMRITFNKNGKHMLLRKDNDNNNNGTKILGTSDDLELLKSFQDISKYNDRKINSGYIRQGRKFTNFDYMMDSKI